MEGAHLSHGSPAAPHQACPQACHMDTPWRPRPARTAVPRHLKGSSPSPGVRLFLTLWPRLLPERQPKEWLQRVDGWRGEARAFTLKIQMRKRMRKAIRPAEEEHLWMTSSGAQNWAGSLITVKVRSIIRRAVEARTFQTSWKRTRRSCILKCSTKKAGGETPTVHLRPEAALHLRVSWIGTTGSHLTEVLNLSADPSRSHPLVSALRVRDRSPRLAFRAFCLSSCSTLSLFELLNVHKLVNVCQTTTVCSNHSHNLLLSAIITLSESLRPF